MIDFFPLNCKDEDSVNALLYNADTILQVKRVIIQYYENQEPREEFYREPEEKDKLNENEN